jgi:hypothetical protein
VNPRRIAHSGGQAMSGRVVAILLDVGATNQPAANKRHSSHVSREISTLPPFPSVSLLSPV